MATDVLFFSLSGFFGGEDSPGKKIWPSSSSVVVLRVLLRLGDSSADFSAAARIKAGADKALPSVTALSLSTGTGGLDSVSIDLSISERSGGNAPAALWPIRPKMRFQVTFLVAFDPSSVNCEPVPGESFVTSDDFWYKELSS